ncbi:ribonucleotide reductase large subunit [Dishui Lake large algae virus 1]|nr:ribonucleotide reductase large subunit [Dishui Lake large algae virus 1]
MRVIKRNGEKEAVSFDKVLKRIQSICNDLPGVDAHNIAQKVCSRIFDGVKTSELDELSAQMCSTLITEHPDYGTLGARIIISNHHKNTSPSFSETITMLWNSTDTHGKQNSLISEELYRFVIANKEKLNNVIDYQKDYLFDYFGFKTLERSYLLKVSGRTVERPQHMWMRVSLGIHGDDLRAALETYDLMSKKMFTHATPTLFNAGTPRAQLASCYLLSMEDSITGIYKTLGDCAQISKYSGGIGMHIHAIRSRNSHIRGTNGSSTGIVPMLRVYNNTARYVNQCFGKDTVVYTKEGAKTVDEVKVGDMLVTSDGTFKPVLQVARNYVDKNVLEMDVMHCMLPVKVTKEHEIYTVRNVPLCTSYNIILDDLKKEKYYPEYVAAGELHKGDLMAFPIPTLVQDVEEDIDFFRMYGIILGDGHASKRQSSNCVEFGVCLGMETKRDTYAFVTSFLASKGIHFWTYADNAKNTISVRWTQNKDKLNITYDDLYDTNHHKIVRDEYLHLPETKTMALLHGLLETDGHADKEIYFFSTSKKLAHAVRYVLLRIGILTSGNLKKCNPIPRLIRENKYIKGNHDMYAVRIPRHPKLRYVYGDRITYSTKLKYFEYDNKLWTRVKEVRETEYKGYVYDFNMKDNHNYLTEMGLVHNSGKRNGSIAVYLEPWHADIENFIELRKNHGNEEERCRDLFTAMWIPDLFMKRVQADAEWSLMCPDECPGLSDVYGEEFDKLYEKYENDGRYRKKVKAQQIWLAILKSQIETGTPYLLYKDAVNKKSNQKHSGVIKSSNLCVAPETKILTKDGYKEIGSLSGMDISIWNGKEWSATRVMKTGENQELIKVRFSDGSFIECTPYHKFYTQDGYLSNYKKDVITNSHVKETEAKNLVPGMKLIRWDLPTMSFSKKELKYAYTHGIMCGDGTLCSSTPEKPCNFYPLDGSDFCGRHQYMKYLDGSMLNEGNKCRANSYVSQYKVSLYGEKKELLPFMKYRYSFENKSSNTIDVILYADIEKKFFVPHEYSLNSKLEWLAGLLDTDGTIARNGEWGNVQIGSVDENFLKEVKQMLETMGVHSKITKLRDECMKMMPDQHEGYKEYKCKAFYRLQIASAGINHLLNLGLNTHRLDFSDYKRNQTNKLRNIQVTSIEWTGRISDTFCVNEPKRHAVVFNGILTGNCTEITEISNSKETAVCNLASMALASYVKKDADGKFYYDFDTLHSVAEVITKNLNKVIDRTFYPVPETEYSNRKHRPIGIGVQGLADTFALMRMPFDSPEAAQLNREIFETIYHGAVSSSMKIAKEREELLAELENHDTSAKRKTFIRKKLHMTDAEKKLEKWRGSYETFAGSPAASGKFQFDMWAEADGTEFKHSGRWDWETLRSDIMKYGMRNSLLLAPMPTASTSQILGSNEAFEPFTTNIYQRRTLSGEFTLINKYLINDLIRLGIWSIDLKNELLANGGSIQNIENIPDDIKALYKTVWEIKQRVLIDQSADRGVYVCQSQSLNLFVEDPDMNKLTSMHFYAWKRGLKTGIYYLRTRPKVKTAAFTLKIDKRSAAGEKQHVSQEQSPDVTEEMIMACRRDNPEGCLMCGS